MRNVLLTLFATSTFFLAIAAYMQADRTMVINMDGIEMVSAEQDSLNAALAAYQIQAGN